MLLSRLAIMISKLASVILKKGFKKGTSLPGKIAIKICPNIMRYVSKNTKIVLITGTNGKTTTTSMVYHMSLKTTHTFSNVSGANMEWGIITSFIDDYRFFKKTPKTAIIEIDEANVPLICKHVKPDILCITNLFRDQLDRYGEVYTTLEKIMTGVKMHPETLLILNGDEPLLGNLDCPNPKRYYGFNVSPNHNDQIDMNTDAKHCIRCQHPYHYDFITYNHLGHYQCVHCGFKRPELEDAITCVKEMTPDASIVSINDQEFIISQAGLYNIYNGLCACSIAKSLNIEDTIIQDILAHQESRFGRQEVIQLNDKVMTIFLVKNPAGFNQTIDTIALDKEPFSCLFMLNDRYADGTDVSWIYDVHLETLASLPIQAYYIGGIRRYDMATRLKIATNNNATLNVYQDYKAITEAVLNAPTKKVYATLTYTAMLEYRKYLENAGYIKDYWR